MSDIGIRFDPPILLIALLIGAGIYLLVGLIAVVMALIQWSQHGRAGRVARLGFAMGGGAGVLAGGVFGWWINGTTYQRLPDWADQLTWVWAVVFAAGCWALTRVRP